MRKIKYKLIEDRIYDDTLKSWYYKTSMRFYDHRGRRVMESSYQESGDKIRSNESASLNLYQGNKLMQRLRFIEKGKLSSWIVKKYNEQGLLIGSKQYDSSGDILHKETFVYDNKGRKSIWYHNVYKPDSDSEFRYYYDVNNRLISTTCTSSDTEMIEWYYKYDNNNRLLEEFQSGNYIFKTKYFYNAKGYVIKKEYCGKDDEYYGATTFEHDKNGNCLVMKSYNHQLLEIIESKYNKNSNLISRHNYYCFHKDNKVDKVLYQEESIKNVYYSCLEISFLWLRSITSSLSERLSGSHE